MKFVLRSLFRSPLFTIVAVLSLGLGIGANSAIFSLLDQVLLRSLPVEKPEQLVMLDWDGTFQGSAREDHSFAYPMYTAFRDKTVDVFSGVIARFGTSADLGWKGAAERAQVELVSGNYFDVLGVKSAIGRTLTPDDDKIRDAEPYAVLSYNYWQKRFGGNPAVLNGTIDVNHQPMTIIGVAQRGFKGAEIGSPADLFLPMMMKRAVTPTWDDRDRRNSVWLNIIARLKPGVSVKQALAASTLLYRQECLEDLKVMDRVTPRFRKRYLSNKFFVVPASKGLSALRDQFSTPLVVLMAMVGTLLLIACGNVANLLVARAATRQKEIAVRLSLGATKGDIVQLILIESLVLSIAGGALALIFASWSGSLLIRLLPFERLSGAFSTAPDMRVLLFTFGLCILTAFIFGLIPALRVANPDVAPTLKNESRSFTGGHVRFRKGMVAAQIALSLLLLIGAGLFARSLYNLMSTSPGLRTDKMLTFSVDPSLARYPQQRALQTYEAIQDSIAALPGAESVSASENPMLSGDFGMITTAAEGYYAKEGEDLNPEVNAVLPRFFSTLGIPLVAGREFTEADQLGAPKVAIVNQSLVNYYFRDRDPIGRHIGFGPPTTRKLDIEIVGVVKDVRTIDLKKPANRQVWLAALQDEKPTSISYYVHFAGDPASMAGLVRRALARLDPELSLYNMKTVVTQIRETDYTDRMITMLSIAFGTLATLLAGVGLYGVMAFTVAQRTRELGIRMALGAQRRTVLGLVMREVAFLAAVGIIAALPVALGLGHLIQKQLYQLKPSDPVTLIGATMLLSMVALLAGYLPALRATRIDPMHALRWD